MKALIILFIISNFSLMANASYSYKKSETLRTTKEPVIGKRKFKRIVATMEREFSDYALRNDERLLMYAGWNDPTADHALARRWESAQVLIFRGMAHRREINQDALILIICHELGHLYGGDPLKNARDQISAEGQADYFASNKCLRRALRIFNDKDIEKRSLFAIRNVGKFLANNWGHPIPHQSTPDTSVTDETLLEHPTPQCRFDTLLAGLNHTPRPKCWYAGH